MVWFVVIITDTPLDLWWLVWQIFHEIKQSSPYNLFYFALCLYSYISVPTDISRTWIFAFLVVVWVYLPGSFCAGQHALTCLVYFDHIVSRRISVCVSVWLCLCSCVSVCVGECVLLLLSDVSRYVITTCHVTRILARQDADTKARLGWCSDAVYYGSGWVNLLTRSSCCWPW